MKRKVIAMEIQTIFERYEFKYLITLEQFQQLKKLMSQYMNEDSYGLSTICNIYLDTPDYLLIRRSLEGPIYKEKIRLRSYGVVKENGKIFYELKKKYDSIVYKRRITLEEGQLQDYFISDPSLSETQIGKEIAYCFTRYKNLEPKVFLSYEREAFYGKMDESFRITFDKNIIWRDYDLSLDKGIYGNPLISNNSILLEIKSITSIPLWLVQFLSKNHIYKTSFSKYGSAYTAIIKRKEFGGKVYVD